MTEPSYTIEELLQLMRALRAPQGGCPWDLQQSLHSLIPYTLEEAYEVADAIEQGDAQALRQELGDLLFQVVFYAQLCEEAGQFNFKAVVAALVAKLLRRHPHVFPEGTLASAGQAAPIAAAQVKQNWEAIKQRERGARAQQSLLDDIPRALPAMARAEKLQKRAAQVGFDWHQASEVLAKLQEEIVELQQAITEGAQDSAPCTQIDEELGDVFFTLINLSRHLRLNPEMSLRRANDKFERRLRFIEQRLRADQLDFKDADSELLEQLWQRAKDEEKR